MGNFTLTIFIFFLLKIHIKQSFHSFFFIHFHVIPNKIFRIYGKGKCQGSQALNINLHYENKPSNYAN